MIGMFAAALLFVMASCEKIGDLNIDSIEGKYIGTLTKTSGLKSTAGEIFDAAAEITKTKQGELTVHCYGGGLDTTFMLNYFENRDSVLVCATAANFSQMYGHAMGQGQMGSGMMGNLSGNSSEWINHMNQNHQAGESHFGGFKMTDSSFGYTFKMPSGDLQFHGVKK